MSQLVVKQVIDPAVEAAKKAISGAMDEAIREEKEALLGSQKVSKLLKMYREAVEKVKAIEEEANEAGLSLHTTGDTPISLKYEYGWDNEGRRSIYTYSAPELVKLCRPYKAAMEKVNDLRQEAIIGLSTKGEAREAITKFQTELQKLIQTLKKGGL